MRRRRDLLGGVLVAALALSAVACSDDDADDAGRPGEVESGEPVDGGTLRVGIGGPLVLDPAAASVADPAAMLMADLLHDGLTELDEGGAAVPALAESWTADETFQTWRFTLAADASFASGRLVTATEVVGSLQHVVTGGDASLAALRLEDVVGFRAFLDGTAPELTGLRAVDPRTVEIALASPLSILPELLAAPSYGVVASPAALPAPAALDLSGDWAVDPADADGTRVRLARRDGHPGHLDGVELRSFADASAAYRAFEDGDVDWAPIPGDRFGAAIEAHGDDHVAPFQAELFFGLRSDAPGFGDVRFRRAIAAAIDREAIVDAVYPDLADALDTVVPTGIPGRPGERCTECEHDPVRARTLLAEAFPDGAVPQVALDYDASPAQEAMAAIVADQLDAVGIDTVQRPLPLADYQHFVVSGAQQLFSFGWIGTYSSPDAYLAPLFRSASDDNLVALRSQGVDDVLARARAEADPAKRAELWAQAQQLVLDEAYVVPIAQFRTQVVVAPRVRGLEHAVDGTVHWPEVWLADA